MLFSPYPSNLAFRSIFDPSFLFQTFNADGGSVNAVRTTGFRRCVAIGEHLASVGRAYGCGEGGKRRAVRCECFPVGFRPFVLFIDFFTQNLYGQKITLLSKC